MKAVSIAPWAVGCGLCLQAPKGRGDIHAGRRHQPQAGRPADTTRSCRDGVRSTRRKSAPSLAEEHPPAQISNAELSSPRAAKGHELPEKSKPLEEHSASHQIASMKASRESLQDPVAKPPPWHCQRLRALHQGSAPAPREPPASEALRREARKPGGLRRPRRCTSQITKHPSKAKSPSNLERRPACRTLAGRAGTTEQHQKQKP